MKKNKSKIPLIIIPVRMGSKRLKNKNILPIKGLPMFVFVAKEVQKSKLTIIPLKNSLQPSGQSVALQSIACGTPVLITKTEGFWDTKNFQDQKNIFFAKDNDLSNWIDKIKNILEMDSERIGKVISNGIETVYKHYDLNEFSKKIEAILLDRK